MPSPKGADFDWDITENMKREAGGEADSVPLEAEPSVEVSRGKAPRQRPVRTAKHDKGRKKWEWHYCQRCKFRGAYLPPDAIGLKMCSRCVALDTPHPHLHPKEYARITLADGIIRRRRR
jgi:hypothetical protein